MSANVFQRIQGVAYTSLTTLLCGLAVMSIPSSDQEPLEDVFFIEPPVHRVQEAIELVSRFVLYCLLQYLGADDNFWEDPTFFFNFHDVHSNFSLFVVLKFEPKIRPFMRLQPKFSIFERFPTIGFPTNIYF